MSEHDNKIYQYPNLVIRIKDLESLPLYYNPLRFTSQTPFPYRTVWGRVLVRAVGWCLGRCICDDPHGRIDRKPAVIGVASHTNLYVGKSSKRQDVLCVKMVKRSYE